MEEKLREAACFGDVDALNKLLAAGANVNGQHKVRRISDQIDDIFDSTFNKRHKNVKGHKILKVNSVNHDGSGKSGTITLPAAGSSEYGFATRKASPGNCVRRKRHGNRFIP
jgi:hypothetical protein